MTSSPSNEQFSDALARLLADSQILRLKTQNFHWHIEGPQFFSLHEVFATQYEQLAEAVDEIAERMLTLGWQAPATMTQYLALASIEDDAVANSAAEMLSALEDGHGKIARKAAEVQKIAAEFGDEATADLMIKRIQEHDKTAWMLRACQAGPHSLRVE